MRDQQTSVEEERAPVIMLPDVTTVGGLVKVLNALGVTPRDIMVIMHALKEAGALHAELVSL
jgi:flagellar P-ring protein precursor FlgI